MEKQQPQNQEPREDQNRDSPINTKDAYKSETDKSLTHDESPDTDPSQIADKASFSDKKQNDRSRFEGEVKI